MKTKTNVLIFVSLFILLSSLTAGFAINSYVPPYIVNLYNASYYTTNITYSINQSTVNNISGACGTGFVLQNVTAGGVFQCVATSSGSGTVTSIVFRNGFNQTTITTSGTVDLNYSAVQQRVNDTCAVGSSIRVINLDGSVVCENDSTGSGTVTSVATDDSLIGGTITTSGTLGINLSNVSQMMAIINGNWSAQQSLYATLVYVQNYVAGVNNLSQSTVQSLINANGNYSADSVAIYNNITALQTSNTTIWSWLSDVYNNVTSLFTSNTSTNLRIDNLNSTKAGLSTATCSAGFYVQNVTTTTGGVTTQCALDTTGGSSGGGINNDNSELNFSYNGIMIDEQCGLAGTSGAYAQWYGVAISSGNTGVGIGTATHPCVRTLATSATASSGYTMTTGTDMFVLAGGEIFELIFNKTIRTGVGVNYSIMRMGFYDTTTTTSPTDGVYFFANNQTLTAQTVNNGVGATSLTNYTLLNSTWYRARIEIVNTTQAVFKLYNSTDSNGAGDTNLVWEYAMNQSLPSSYARRLGSAYGAYRNGGGATGETLAEIDYVSLWINRTITR